MENENKDLQGVENEETMTPEEKVREDIRSKVADAAAEIQDEILLTDNDEVVSNAFDDTTEGAVTEAEFEGELTEEVKPEPVKVTVKRSSFIVSLIGSAVLGALILFLCLQIPKWVAAMPEGSAVASVNGEEITDLDVNYYIYVQAMQYAQKNGLSEDELPTYDWNQEVDGKVLANTIKENAVNDAVNEVITIKKGEENGIVLSDEEKSQIKTQVDGITSAYGEDGFKLRARAMGIASPKQYSKMYTRVMAAQNVQTDMSENPDKYYPENIDDLNEYIQPDRATVKHILISTTATSSSETAPTPEEAKAKAETALQRAQSGEDFDALVEELNEDPGASEDGYTFVAGEMDPAFEEAAFGLKINEISGLVESTYGYHIIKRIPGVYELQSYWKATSDYKIKIKTGKVKKLDIAAVLTDIADANAEIEAQSASSSASK